eukprot:gnl/TRDRNA2_/TRDRNA2_136869_c0_seq1.p1 gnl/TRDRNA2_/TRDRNA2_136869_c0~~gnl/TRDRNA2_/TRDRNA2_136869_c0_seq1.p1  ORF type:complete len:1012 (-),score=227.89 gnl/TRDRNA2_/TRDRNA2_136869_c0_seq1:32-3067(-)
MLGLRGDRFTRKLAAVEEQASLQPGGRARISRLDVAPQLNGKEVEVLDFKEGFSAWRVKLGDGVVKLVAAKSLIPITTSCAVSATPAAPGGSAAAPSSAEHTRPQYGESARTATVNFPPAADAPRPDNEVHLQLQRGGKACIQGLKGLVHLNDQEVDLLDFNELSGKWHVQLGDGSRASYKPENLVPLPWEADEAVQHAPAPGGTDQVNDANAARAWLLGPAGRAATGLSRPAVAEGNAWTRPHATDVPVKQRAKGSVWVRPQAEDMPSHPPSLVPVPAAPAARSLVDLGRHVSDIEEEDVCPFENAVCACCGELDEEQEPLLCGRCMAVPYCSAECQAEHWQTHRAECRLWLQFGVRACIHSLEGPPDVTDLNGQEVILRVMPEDNGRLVKVEFDGAPGETEEVDPSNLAPLSSVRRVRKQREPPIQEEDDDEAELEGQEEYVPPMELEDDEWLQPGVHALVVGLLDHAARFNGEQVLVKEFKADTGFWDVQFARGTIKSLKPENLVPLEGLVPKNHALDAADDAEWCQPGVTAYLCNLDGAQECLNGEEVVVQKLDDDGRWEIMFCCGSVRAIDPENLCRELVGSEDEEWDDEELLDEQDESESSDEIELRPPGGKDSWLKPGVHAFLTGLDSFDAGDLNGMQVIVKKYIAAASRWDVQFLEGGAVIPVRPENLAATDSRQTVWEPKPGTRAFVQGLETNVSNNGKEVEVLEFKAGFLDADGRWRCRTQGGELLWLAARNLTDESWLKPGARARVQGFDDTLDGEEVVLEHYLKGEGGLEGKWDVRFENGAVFSVSPSALVPVAGGVAAKSKPPSAQHRLTQSKDAMTFEDPNWRERHIDPDTKIAYSLGEAQAHWAGQWTEAEIEWYWTTQMPKAEGPTSPPKINVTKAAKDAFRELGIQVPKLGAPTPKPKPGPKEIPSKKKVKRRVPKDDEGAREAKKDDGSESRGARRTAALAEALKKKSVAPEQDRAVYTMLSEIGQKKKDREAAKKRAELEKLQGWAPVSVGF